MSAITSCSAAFVCMPKVGNGPEADSVDFGGLRTFAADAKVRTDFRKADLGFNCGQIG